MVSHTLQKQLSDSLRKTYPLNICEIRWATIEGEGIPPAVIEDAVVKKETPIDDADIVEKTEEVLEEAIVDAERIGQ